jgi:membrane protein implicated in regulation of membrane protease activity
VARSPTRLLVLGKYLAFQLPGWLAIATFAWGAHHWLGLAQGLAWAALAAFVLKDLALYPFVRDAYEVEPRPPGHHLEGQIAIAEDALAPRGHVRLGPERWQARLAPGSPPVAPGDPVVVEAVEGLSLRVKKGDGPPR